jgi:hypothetical protein
MPSCLHMQPLSLQHPPPPAPMPVCPADAVSSGGVALIEAQASSADPG